MRCPSCGSENIPGNEQCKSCSTPLAPLDLPTPFDKIELSLMSDPVSILAPKPPVTIALSATLSMAVQQMIDRGVGAVLVTDDQNCLVGILTERDFLTKVAGVAEFRDLYVRDFMTPTPETVQPSDKLSLALCKMDVGRYRHLPVVDNHGLPVGVISLRDVLRHVTRLCRDG